MTSSDRPKRPSARPSARPAGRASDAPPGSARAGNPDATPGAPAAPAKGGRAAQRPAAKANAARVSVRRGSDAQQPAGAKARAPGDAQRAGRSEKRAAGAPRDAGRGSKARKVQKPVPPRIATLPPAPSAALPTFARVAPAPLSLSNTPAANDDGDDLFSAADPHPELALGLTLGVEQADEESGGLPGGPLSRLTRGSGSDRRAQEAALKGAQSLLSSDYYVRQYGAHGMRSLSADVDEYGLDPYVEERARPWLEVLCTHYFRLDLEGARRIPAEGRALLVANRSGSVPWDGLMLHTALRMQRPELQPVRWLSEDSVIHYPFLGVFMNRLGAVRACPENAERLLSQDRLVAVFPEGAQGSQKLFRDRYRLQRFGRGGYVKLALKLGAPILPTAIIGAEETNPLLARLKLFGRAAGDEYLPITPTFPWLGLAGLLPAPVKWRVIVGEPVDLSAYGPEAAEDALVVHRLNEQIRSILQALLDQGTASRRSVLFG
jgi:1-acyl-sn-glycerol-3-phosphate acyltransferase